MDYRQDCLDYMCSLESLTLDDFEETDRTNCKYILRRWGEFYTLTDSSYNYLYDPFKSYITVAMQDDVYYKIKS